MTSLMAELLGRENGVLHGKGGSMHLSDVAHGACVVDVRSLVPLDVSTLLGAVRATGRLVTVEENPRLCGWGAEIASIVVGEAFDDLNARIVRITTPRVPLPAAEALEDLAIPSVERIVETVRGNMG